MLGLPNTTEINRPLAKKAIFDKFKPVSADRQRFDAEIQRLALVNEVSPATTNIAAGEGVQAFYAVHLCLRGGKCHPKNLILLSRWIDQTMLFILEHAGDARLAVYRAGWVIETDAKPLGEWDIKLAGLNFDAVWENIIAEIAGITLVEGVPLDEQLIAEEERKKLLRQIERLEKRAMSEKQPRRKWELVQEIKKLKREIGE